MPTDAKLDICVDVLNEALQVKDIACAQKILQKVGKQMSYLTCLLT